LLARLLLVGLCLSLSWNFAFGAELGKPPTFPQDLTGLGLSVSEKAIGGVEVFLPTSLSVTPRSRETSRQFFNTYYLGAPSPVIDWTGNRGNCNEGSTSLTFREAVLQRLNYFRAMAGVPAQVAFSDTYSAKDQKAALMMSVNGSLSHSPPSDWTCYSADGSEAAGNSNLALGAHGWDAIDLFIADPGSGNGVAGHRRWIFYPQTQHMGTGDIPSGGGWAANALWVFDENLWGPRPATREEYVAWPPPGYTPYQVVYARWSFSYTGANFSGATVTMTQNGAGVPVVQEAVANGYGENTLVWIPNGMSSGTPWPKPVADTKYRVTIDNVGIAGTPRSFSYDVTVFDPAISSVKDLPFLPLLLD
jgi:uncharacterized protein YkwD